jgi:hypothetical protein
MTWPQTYFALGMLAGANIAMTFAFALKGNYVMVVACVLMALAAYFLARKIRAPLRWP